MFDADDNRKDTSVDAAVLKEVAAHQDGVGARTLVQKMDHYPKRDVQVAIQRTLDRGELKLGSRLELRVRKSA